MPAAARAHGMHSADRLGPRGNTRHSPQNAAWHVRHFPTASSNVCFAQNAMWTGIATRRANLDTSLLVARDGRSVHRRGPLLDVARGRGAGGRGVGVARAGPT